MLNIGSGRKRKKGRKKETLQPGRVSQVEAENAFSLRAAFHAVVAFCEGAD